MTAVKGTITRDMLAPFFAGNPRLLRAFTDQSDQVAETAVAVEATTVAIQDAAFVTLGSNEALTNERILTGSEGVALTDDGNRVTLDIGLGAAAVTGGFRLTFVATGETNIGLPTNGTLATLNGTETMRNKTLDQPKITGLGDYVDDAAAATGGVPVTGLYRNGSVLMVRVA